MTNNDDAEQNAKLDALLHDLRDLGRLDARAKTFGQDLGARLLLQAQQQTARHETRMPSMLKLPTHPRTVAPRWLQQTRPRIIASGAALLLALGSLLAYLHGQGPTLVSAKTILHHTALALQAADPGEVAHNISLAHTVNARGVDAGVSGISANTNPDVTIEQWTQRDAHGVITRQDIRFTNPQGKLLQHTVQDGTSLKLYNAQIGTTDVMTVTPSIPPRNQMVPDPFDTTSLRQFILDVQAGADQEARVLPPQTVDGRAVYVVQVVRHMILPVGHVDTETTPRTFIVTLYVDQGTYVIHKLETKAVNVAGRLLTSTTERVILNDLVPASTMPTQIFSRHSLTSSRR